MAKVRNSPKQQSKPSPTYANDPTGFWDANRKANDENWKAILAESTIIGADKAELARVFRGILSWLTVTVRWNRIEFQASLDDGQATQPLEAGGMGATGTITIVFAESQFGNRPLPSQHDTCELQVQGKWKNFTITSVSYGFDGHDDAMLATLEPEDSE
jgi:hypothetical protein